MTTFRLHKYQERAFTSDKRVIVIAAGIQSGKTTAGALWLGSKGGQISSESNLIICAPTYKILTQATLPKFLQVFKPFGRYNKVDSVFKFHGGPTAYIRSLTDPNSLEGITDVEAIWLDEGGLISRYAWENVEGRSAFRQAPILISTTPYALNWLFGMWEEWKRGERSEVDFIQFTSRDNPHFPDAEFERQRRLLDSRRFQMKYMGQFGKMEGLVYEKINTCRSFRLEPGTRFYGGIDWGYTNPFVLSIRAITPRGIHYRVAEFYKSGLMIEEIVRICQQRREIYGIELFIADPSAPANIEALNRGGVTCIPGNNNVRHGIDEQNRLFREEKFFIFEDDNPMGVDEYNTYHYPEPRDYKIDEDQKEPEPVKANDHGCFLGSTLVQTPHGEKKIREIKVGDLVTTPLGFSRVINAGPTGRRSVVKVVLTNGRHIFCTPDHPFYLFKKGFDSPTVDGIVSVWDGVKNNLLSWIIISIVGMATITADRLNSIGIYGLNIIKNLSQKVITYITKMVTQQIMTYPTWSAYQHQSTNLSITRNRKQEVLHQKTLLIWKRFGKDLKYGIVRKEVEHGIANMVGSQWRKGKAWRRFVAIAKRSFKPSALKPSTVRTIVSRMHDVKVVLMMLKKYASSVIKRSLSINTLEPKPVVIAAVENSSSKIETVYNLTTEHGCYYANGVLVSNCDADRYVTMYLAKTEKVHMGRDAAIQAQMPTDVIKRKEWLIKGGSSRFQS